MDNKNENTQSEASFANPAEYSELNQTQLGGALITLSEKFDAADRYMVCEYRLGNSFGAVLPDYVGVTPDFLEALSEYTNRVQYCVSCVQSERNVRQSMDGVQHITLTADDCINGTANGDIKGKIIIIKPEVLSPEYRRSDHQLKLVQGGFGASPNSRGNAVYCKDLYSGKESRFERCDVLGVADEAKLPQWARVKIAALHDANLDAKVDAPGTPQKESVFKRMERLKGEHPPASKPTKSKKPPKQER